MVLAGGAVLAGGIALAIANEPLSPGGGGYGSRGSGIVVAAAGGAVRVGLFGRALTRDPHRGSLEQRASSGTWVCTKLTVDVAELGDAAEVYFQFDPELGVGEFSEKEPEYRESLFRALRWAMRYETPPRVPAP